ncbi:MAG: nicotinate-nucleotide adenylyltransferase [Lachnospiraceae bacterium]|nr:nicotinate-nucleotide adenylyltransferase [Lachnospiraceae bacterium]
MAKIGFLGGTFNPIHNGHLYLADNAYKQLKLNKVLIVPSGISYLKQDIDILSKDIRSDMTKIAISDYPYFEFSDIEIKREGNTYTYETLLELRKEYSNDTIYFIIGADTLNNMESWKCPDIIFANCHIAVMVRDTTDKNEISKICMFYEEKYNANTVILDVEKTDVSSTEIRRLIRNGCYDQVKNMLPEKVLKYIEDNHLYRGN